MIIFDRDIQALVLKTKNDAGAREELIRQKEESILKIASKTCKKYVSKSDDEWSIALYAFNKAIDSYEKDRGNFMAFASTLIKRDLIDYYRHEQKYDQEFSVPPSAFDDSDEEEESAITYEVNKISINKSNNGLVEEISILSESLKGFSIDFMELTECSPKQDRTRNECLKVSEYIAKEQAIYKKMMLKHQLPASEVTKQTGVSVKLLDKYRKYIITSAIILHDEYSYLSGYLKH